MIMDSGRKPTRIRAKINYSKLLSPEDESDDDFATGFDSDTTLPLTIDPDPPKKQASKRKRKTYECDGEHSDADFLPDDSPPKIKSKKVLSKKDATKKRPLQSQCKSTAVPSPSVIQQLNTSLSAPLITAQRKTPLQGSTITNSAPPPGSKPLVEFLTSHNRSKISTPATPVSRDHVSFCVTPTSGLRLGLSRRNIAKPLHTNVRFTH